MTKKLGLAAVGGILVLGSLAFMRDQGDAGGQAAAAGPLANLVGQPIAFPHDVHATQFQIDCQYCHFSAERSVDAGIPPVSTCLGCHTLVNGQTERAQAEIQRLREYGTSGESIPWVRLYKISEHAHFPHLRHVNAGVTCQTCHGEVQDMGVLAELNQPLAMGWCVTCHRDNDVRTDCSVCHY